MTEINWTPYNTAMNEGKQNLHDVVDQVIIALPEKYRGGRLLRECCQGDPTGLAWLLDGIEYCAHVPTPGRDEYGNRYSYYSEPING